MKKNAILLVILLISTFALATTLSARINVESDNKVVEVVLDYSEFQDMANQSEETLSWWFRKFNGLGIEYVGLQEENLESLMMQNQQLEVFMGWELLQQGNWRETYSPEVAEYIDYKQISEFDVFITTGTQEVFDFIYQGLTERYDAEYFDILSQEAPFAIVMKGTIEEALYQQSLHLIDANRKVSQQRHKPYSSKLMQVGLGFDVDKINTVKESGLKVLPRPNTYKAWMSEKYLETVFQEFETYEMQPSVLIFGGGEVLGYPVADDLVTRYMIENDIKAGLVESFVQRGHLEPDGLDLMVRSLDYNAVRIFSVWPFIQERFKYYNYEGAEEIENSLYRAVTERNIRLIFFKPIKQDKYTVRYDQFIYLTDYNEYEKMFERFQTRIASHGMVLGSSSRMPSIRVRIAKQTLMGWGIVAASMLLLTYLLKLNKKVKYSLLVIGLLLVPIAFLVRPMLADKMMALWAAMVFPSLAMVYFCNRCFHYVYKEEKTTKLHQQILYAIKGLVIVSAISFLGALFVAAILSHIEYLLEMDIFRGVKIGQMIPMVAYVVIYASYFGYKRKNNKDQQPSLKYEDIKNFLFEDIKIIYVIFAMLFLGAGYIYLARTGHESNIQASTMELIFRNVLEENLLARPRNKEFLIGFPVLMMGIYFAKNKMKSLAFLAGLVAMIGQTSIVNTFSHLRTPVYLSAARTFYSLVFGIVVGVIYILLFEIAMRLLKYVKEMKVFQQNV
ncbi:hypothetical protein CACET_c33160 [Clostridium aceticum]|uniref:Uncharacterized protein n=1 Tax=Clostridium aceticum TaxID=84022 RepID=A0A0D8IEA2_9CLOT|nr:DUF5693 family protein [Clostridium aceticum]AKL96760.1 hypothetical protein CACET_c33160 [Clostridium aceticum]KJF27521.1 hypothetical protein TZ02_06935 [Clostridium aceticum]